MLRHFALLIFSFWVQTCFGQSINEVEYFIDTDPGNGMGQNITVDTPDDSIDQAFTLSVSNYEAGFHLLVLRAKDDQNFWTTTLAHLFYIQPNNYTFPPLENFNNSIVKGEYFFDTDPGENNGTEVDLPVGSNISLLTTLDADSLSLGIHKLGLRVKQLNGEWSTTFFVNVTITNLPSGCNLPISSFTNGNANANQSMTFTNTSTSTNINTTYEWDINADGSIEYNTENISHVFTQSGTFPVKLKVINGIDCYESFTKLVEVGPYNSKDISLNIAGPYCNGDTIVLTAPTGGNWIWNDGVTTQIREATNSDTYQVVYTDLNGNTALSNSLPIYFGSLPVYTSLTNPTYNGQLLGNVEISVVNTLEDYEYNWSNGDTTSVISELSFGQYLVTITNENCFSLDTFIIENKSNTPNLEITSIEYFIGNIDPGPGNGTIVYQNLASDSFNLYFEIDTSVLSLGINKLNFRVKQDDGLWGIIQTTYFFLDNIPQPIASGGINKLEYYFDADNGPGSGVALDVNPLMEIINDEFPVTFNNLQPGLHTLTVRPMNEAGDWGIEKSISFLIDAPIESIDTNEYPLVKGEYFFDVDNGEGSGTPFSFLVSENINIKRVFNVSALSIGSHKLGIRVKELNGDWSLPKYVDINVIAAPCTLPQANFTFTNPIAGVANTFINTSSNILGSSIFSWDVLADGNSEYTTQDVTHTFSNAGFYDVYMKIDNGINCTTSIIKKVEVNPLSNDDIIVDGLLTFCEGDTTTLIAPAGTQHLWNNGNTNNEIFITQSGSYQVTYIDLNGLTRISDVVNIKVHPKLNTTINISPANTGLMNGSAQVEVNGGTGYLHNYNWSNGQITPAIVNQNSGNYFVTISDQYCPDTLAIFIPNVSPPLNSLIEAEYFITQDPGPGNGIPFTITKSDDINSFFNLDINSLGFGSHSFYFRVKDNQGLWSIVQNVLIYIPETSVVDQSNPLIVSGQYYFDGDPGINNENLFSFSPADSIISRNVPITFANLSPGLHSLNIRVKNDEQNWSNNLNIQIIVDLPLESPDTTRYKIVKAEMFYASDPGEGKGIPIPVSPEFILNQTITLNVDTLSTGNHTAYIRVMTLNRQWSTPKSISFNVFDGGCSQPIAEFNYVTADANSPILFQNLSTNTDTSTVYEWDIFNDGIIDYYSEDISYTFVNAGNYQVKLNVINSLGCYESVVKEVKVGPYFIDTISLSMNAPICGGDTIYLSAPEGSEYLWNTGDTTQIISVTSNGVFQVSYIDLNSNEELTDEKSISFIPEIKFYLEKNNANIGQNNGSANVFVLNGNVNQYSYLWSNGSIEAMQDSLNAGIYFVTISNSFCEKIEEIVISTIPNQTGLISAEYYLGDIDPGPGNGTSFIIPMDTSINSFYTNQLGSLLPGIYKYNVRVKDNTGIWGIIQNMLISVSDTSVYVLPTKPDIISIEYFFGNIDIGEDSSFIWTALIQDSTINEELNISVAALNSGTNSIYLRVKNEEGQYSIVKGGTFQICNPPATPSISGPSSLCQGTTLNLSASSTTPNATYTWLGPNNFTSSIQNPTINNVGILQDGIYKVQAVLDGNCFSELSELDININLLPTNAGQISSTIFECGENTVFFVPIIQNATNYVWTFPSGVTTLSGNNTNNIAVSFDNFAGMFDLKVKGTNTCGEANFSEILPINTCICSEVGKLTDSGLGSLRHAIGCAETNDTIVVDQSFVGQFFQVTSGPLLIDKNITIQPPSQNNFRGNSNSSRTEDRLVFNNSSNGAAFQIMNGKTLILNQVDVNIGSQTGAHAILNNGTCTLKNTKLIRTEVSNTSHVKNQNGGTLNIEGNCEFINN